MIKRLSPLAALVVLFLADALAYTWPNLAYDFVEEFLWLELTGFAGIPAVCTASPDGTTPSIQAQWLRTVQICFSTSPTTLELWLRHITTWPQPTPESAE
jgi:hypothetical protein